MSLVKSKVSLRADIHQFPTNVFGSTADLVAPRVARHPDTLIVACSELGTAPNYLSFGDKKRFLVLQHLAASIPSEIECNLYDELSLEPIERLFDEHEFRHVIICGKLGSGVIPYWLQSENTSEKDIGWFRKRFQHGTRRLVDDNYVTNSVSARIELMIFEHVLCQIENLLTHRFINMRTRTGETSLYGWVVDNESARIYSYRSSQSAYVLV
jgi:carbonic anhydrase